MNVEELDQLVARARDAEGQASQPPPTLLAQARRAARRRRRLVTIGASAGAAVLVVGAGAVVQGWIGSEDGDRDADAVSSPGAREGELGAHGGPCPAVLPGSTDDPGGHGFGPEARATSEPRFASADVAWVCQYGPSETGRTSTGGTEFEWARMQDPRRLDDAQLGSVSRALDGVGPNAAVDEACTDDLGPRWLLVISSGGDLTGVAVDDFGCRDVRLTDDPFAIAPGDPQTGGGTVAGVLTAPDSLVTDLRAWWDSSPADTDARTPPDELHVTCTENGPQVEADSVSAQPTGVVLVVGSMLPKGSYLTYRSAGDGPSGGDLAPRTPTSTTYQIPPGELTLGCATPPDMGETGSVTVTVEDPHGYWRDATLADYGCRPASAQPSWVGGLEGEGATAEEAVARMLDNAATVLGRQFTAEPAPTGYSGADTQTWVAAESGVPALSIAVTRTGDHYSVRPDALCG
jgi:hypothetical protein